MFMKMVMALSSAEKDRVIGNLLAMLKCQREGYDGLTGMSAETKKIYTQYCLDSNLFFDGE